MFTQRELSPFKPVFVSLLIAALSACSGSLGGGAADPETTWPQRPSESSTSLRVDGTNVTVSGVSAGAFMATQLTFAYPEIFRGVGSVAGGPRDCSRGNAYTAIDTCMDHPSQVNVNSLVDTALSDERAKRIGPLSKLRETRVFIFNSPDDSVVNQPAGEKLREFYSRFVDPKNLRAEFSVSSAHGFPSIVSKNECATLKSPFLPNCGYDTAGEIFKFLLADDGLELKRSAPVPGSMHTLDVSKFHVPYSFMSDDAFIYVPASCEHRRCPLHIALHGCSQGSAVIKDQFAVSAGYNEWAEGSGVVVVYPQVEASLVNPKGCFDWFGYTGIDYVSRDATQMRSITQLIAWLSRPN